MLSKRDYVSFHSQNVPKITKNHKNANEDGSDESEMRWVGARRRGVCVASHDPQQTLGTHKFGACMRVRYVLTNVMISKTGPTGEARVGVRVVRTAAGIVLPVTATSHKPNHNWSANDPKTARTALEPLPWVTQVLFVLILYQIRCFAALSRTSIPISRAGFVVETEVITTLRIWPPLPHGGRQLCPDV